MPDTTSDQIPSCDRDEPRDQRDADWEGYQWNVPLDELVDCDKCPSSCQRCYRYGKAKPVWQKWLMVAFYLSLIDIALALLFRFSVFSDTEFYLGPTDQRLIKRGDDDYNMSPLLCSEYRLQSMDGDDQDGGFFAYGLTRSPHLNYQRSEYALQYLNTSISPNEVYVMYHYLGTSSTATLSACAPDRPITVYAVRSVSSMQDWERNQCCGGYSDAFVFNRCNPDGSSSNARRYSAYNGFAGDLFFVFTEAGGEPSYHDNDDYHGNTDNITGYKPINVTIILEKYDYTLKTGTVSDSCNISRNCYIPLDDEDTESILVELPKSALGYVKLRGTCDAALWGYFKYFAVIPLGVVLAFVSIGGVLYLCQREVNRLAAEGDRERAMGTFHQGPPGDAYTRRVGRSGSSLSSVTPLVGYGLDQDMWRGVDNDPPPSYDAVAVSTISSTVNVEEPPPSYSSLRL